MHQIFDVLRAAHQALSFPCCVCKRTVGAHHVFLNPQNGDAVCFSCVGDAQARSGFGPKRGEAAEAPRVDMGKYFEVLGLAEGASPDQVAAAYKKRAFESHPDRARGAAAKRDAQRDLTAINEAYEKICADRREGKAA